MSAPDSFPNPSAPNSDHKPTDLAQTAKKDISDVGDEIKERAAELGEEVKAQAGEIAGKAKGMANEQKDLFASHLGSVSEALQKAAGELESRNESSSQYVRIIADGADKVTSTLRGSDVDDILAIAQDFGRRQPVAFLGVAALLGLAASRFVTASASRREGGAHPDAMQGETGGGQDAQL